MFFPLVLSDWYEPWALLRSDDVATVTGMLLGLNVLDFNLCLKGEDLEKQSTALDWSLFLKDGNYVGSRGKTQAEEEVPISEEDLQAVQQRKLTAALDQKAYTEEINKKLERKVQEASEKIDQLTAANQKLQKQTGGGNFVQATDERLLVRKQNSEYYYFISSVHEFFPPQSLKNEMSDLKDSHRRELESLKMGLSEQNLSELKVTFFGVDFVCLKLIPFFSNRERPASSSRGSNTLLTQSESFGFSWRRSSMLKGSQRAPTSWS